MPTLTAELQTKAAGVWVWRNLPHGALVAVMLGADGRRVLRIARPEAPANDRARDRWATELATFHTHLGTGHWQRLPDEESQGVAARFLELHWGEVEPGKGRCDGCQGLVPFESIWGKAQRCRACAIRAGRDDS